MAPTARGKYQWGAPESSLPDACKAAPPGPYFDRKDVRLHIMNRTIKRIWNIVTSILVAAVVILAILLAGVRLVGFQVFTVLSGSMEPTYHTGSLIYVRQADREDIAVGDPITFRLNGGGVATHRVVGLIPDEQDPAVSSYITKGDANFSEDGRPVRYEDIIGKPVFTIPGLGYVANFIQNPPGTYITLCAGAILLLLVFLPDLLSDNRKKA